MENKFKLNFFKRKYLINKGFQIKYTLYIALVCSLIYAILGYFFYKAILDVTKLLEIKNLTLSGMLKREDNFALYYLIGFFIIQISSLFVLGTLITHRIAGPIFRVGRILKSLSDGKIERVGKLRDRDEFKEIVEPIDKLALLIYDGAKSDFATICEIENDFNEMTNPVSDRQYNITEKINKIKENLVHIKSEKKKILDNSKMS